jgi:hypothetical protein
LYARVPEYSGNFENDLQKRYTTNLVESWNAAMITQCEINQNSSVFTLTEKIVKFYTKQAMHTELGLQGKGKYCLVNSASESVQKQLAACAFEFIRLCVENFLHCTSATSFASFAYALKLDIMCLITSVEAEVYEVAARQIMIKPGDVQILERDDGVNAVCVYDTMTDKNKPTWWTVRTNDIKWTTVRCSCFVYRTRKLCIHVILACQKVGASTYLCNYSKSFKPNATQIIRV